jgi:lipid A 3-O-deacylase
LVASSRPSAPLGAYSFGIVTHHPWKRAVVTKRIRTTLIGLAAMLQCSSANAGGLVDELKLGVLGHDVPYLWSNFRAEPNSVDINIEALLSPSISFLGGTIRPAVGGTINTVGATSHAYIDARWQFETHGGFFLGLGIGGAIHNGQLQLEDWNRKALGSRVLFHFPAEIGYRFDEHNSLSLYFEHTSNGYTVHPNEGLDRLGIRYGYRF